MSRSMKIGLGGLAALVVVVGGLAWWLGYFSDTPDEVNIDAAAEAARNEASDTTEGDAEDETTSSAADDADSSEDTASGDAASPDAQSDGVEGTWTVRPSAEATFVGYRINEVLNTIGDFEVVGRTSDVSGQLAIEDTTITTVDVTADMTTLTTDSSARDSQMRSQALETNDFPEATFVLAEPIELGEIPAEGETIEITAPGDLTIHGVTQRVDFPLQAQLSDGAIIVVGQLEVALADYDIDAPQAPIVASVEDTAVLELSLVFDR